MVLKRTDACLEGVINGDFQAFMTDRIVLEFLTSTFGATDASLFVSPVVQQNPFSFAFNYAANDSLRAFVDLGILRVINGVDYKKTYRCAGG